MVALLLLAAQQTAPSPQPCYDGAGDYSAALQKLATTDPKQVDAMRAFGLAYWMGRLQALEEFRGSYFVHEILVCGTMIKYWDAPLGTKVREFALNAIVQNLDTGMSSDLQSDVQLAYVGLVSEFSKKGDADSAMFDAGAKLAALDPHLLFAQFIEIGKVKEKAVPDIAACGKFSADHPEAPALLRAKMDEIGTKANAGLFSVLTLRDVGLLHAQALSLTVPEKYRWKIPPDAPKE